MTSVLCLGRTTSCCGTASLSSQTPITPSHALYELDNIVMCGKPQCNVGDFACCWHFSNTNVTSLYHFHPHSGHVTPPHADALLISSERNRTPGLLHESRTERCHGLSRAVALRRKRRCPC